MKGPAYTRPDLPSGDIKNSEFGKELSEIGFSALTELVRVAGSTWKRLSIDIPFRVNTPEVCIMCA